MSKLISGYWWAWREVEAGKKSAQTLRKFYPDADIDYPDSSLKLASKKTIKGVKFSNNVLIGKNVIIGKNTQIGANSVIEHDTVIGKNCVVG